MAEQHNSKWIELDRWATDTGTATLKQTETDFPISYSLHSGRGVLLLRPGSLVARWEGVELRMGFAPQVIGQRLFVHALDLEKTIQPLLDPVGFRPKGTIIIDPGHGGADCGTGSILAGPCEKDYTLDWALRLRALLAGQGWEVLLTRSSDVEVPVTNRVAYAVEHQASLFLSLHFNSAAPNHTEAGLETYCLTPAGMPSSLTRGYGDDLSQVFPNNAFDAGNLQLAMRVHTSLLEANGNHDRGVRRARFPGILRGQQCPAVLIEGGYLSNEKEARLIADPTYRQKLAEAIARTLEACARQ